MGVLPAYILMRVGAQWTESRENFPDDFEPAWLGIGYVTADAGALLVLVSIILGAWSACGSCGAGPAASASGARSAIISILLLAAYIVAVWAMTAKPT